MNTTYKTLLPALLISALAALTACDDVLDKEPLLSTTESTIFTDAEKIEANLLGVYSDIKDLLAYKGRAYHDIRAEDIYSLSSNVYQCYTVYEMAVGLTTEDNSDTWTLLYTAINEANTFLANLEEAQDVAGDDYDQFVAEAKFVRALSYYSLYQLYANPYSTGSTQLAVPLRLEAESTTTSNDLARSTIAEVFAQILADLSDANIANLPSGGNSYDAVTRASQGAAHTLRQRIYLEQENWSSAVTEGLAVSGYELEPTVAEVFNNNITEEVIFTFPMADTNKGSTQYAQAYYYCTGDIFVLDDTYGYFAIDGYNLEADTRVSLLISQSSGRYLLGKYPDSSTYLDWIPQFRYAEVLLNLAEAYANLGQDDLARDYLLQVRRRSLAAEDDVLDIDNLTGDDLLEAVYNERRAEFVGEGLRAIDIHRRAESYVKRNGTYTVNGNGYIWPIPTSERSTNSLIED